MSEIKIDDQQFLEILSNAYQMAIDRDDWNINEFVEELKHQLTNVMKKNSYE